MYWNHSVSRTGYRPDSYQPNSDRSSNYLDHPSGLTNADIRALHAQPDAFIPDDGNPQFLLAAEAKAIPQLATGMGQQVARNDKQLFTNAKYVIYEKIHWANFMGTVQKDPVAQTRLLLSAFSDAEWYIGNILADFNGVELPPDARDGIASMRALEGLLIANIRTATGLNLTDDEFRALLENGPGETKQKISLNELIRNDKTMKPGPDSGQQTADPSNQLPSDQSMDAAIARNKQRYMTDDSIYGIKSNPAKFQNAMASANTKVVKNMDAIIRQASTLVEKAEHDPAGNLDALMSALSMLRRGLTITMVANALDDYRPTNQQDGNYGDKKAQFEQLLQKTVGLLKQQGIPADQLLSANTPTDLNAGAHR